MVSKLKDINISAKEIVELIYGGGDLVSEQGLLRRAEEGRLAHKYIQDKYNATDISEYTINYDSEYRDFNLHITGRMDGLLKKTNKYIIEEIKSTHMSLELLDENTYPSHLSQAKMYGYMFLEKENKKSITIRLTYIKVEDFQTTKFEFKYSKQELKDFFFKTIDTYIDWIELIDRKEENRNSSILGLKFPYDHFRTNQYEFMGYCYKTLMKNDILYAVAPTGIGKTIATIFAGLKSISKKEEKLFYLTAKTVGKNIAKETINLLYESGLEAKTCEITSKEKICPMGKERDCNPEKCRFSKGYYNRVFEALRDIYKNEEMFDKETVIHYAYKYTVCPFEFNLDISNYSDIIICDYNYAFNPLNHLIRYFDDNTYKPILLVDEAHNLVSRSRDMYSGSVSKNKIQELKKLAKGSKPSITRDINYALEIMDELEIELDKVNFTVLKEPNLSFINSMKKIISKIDEASSNTQKPLPNRGDIMAIYGDILSFVSMLDYFDENFVFTLEKEEQDFIISIRCLDASKYILDTIQNHTKGTIFFSATLFPIEYYRTLLTQGVGETVKFLSPFDINNLDLIIMDSVSTRYKQRDKSVPKIVETIKVLASSKIGNYIVFFPSYQYLNMVNEELEKEELNFDILIQRKDLSLDERQDYIEFFKTTSVRSQVGMFVMGGMFAEGIDYIGDMLSGVIICGVGLPMIGETNNMLKAYFDEKFNDGFDYTYTYPGLNKVIQAVGRVIRREEDRGVAILIDDRFNTIKYQKLFPLEWKNNKIINNIDYLKRELKKFWDR